jgi:lipid II:glycine glycyltransferase (peptidoglycan interpeptide bridge formation enzyme)
MDRYTFQEISEEQDIDLSSICKETPYTQAGFYGRWQKMLGGYAKRYLVYEGNEAVAYFQTIKYPLARGKNYIYIPYGPVVKEYSDDLLASIKNKLHQIAKEDKAAFVRLDFTPAMRINTLGKHFKKSPPYTYHGAILQPRNEWFLELSKTEDELLADVQRKTRWAIRASERQGVTSEIVTDNFDAYFDDFYRLMVETSGRNGFGLHPKEYYAAIFNDLGKVKNSYLSVARYGNKVLIINVVLVYGDTAMYMFSGSSSEERDRNPSYLALWKAVCHAKQLDCKYFNFGGVSTDSDTHKSWDGLTAFKKKFGGHEVTHSDFYDLVINPAWYRIYTSRRLIKQLHR